MPKNAIAYGTLTKKRRIELERGTKKSKKGNRLGHLAKRLGQHIRSLRKARGWTLHELADATLVSFNHISNIERGEHWPSEAVLQALANAFSIQVETLFNDALSPREISIDEALVVINNAFGKDFEIKMKRPTKK